MPCFFIPAEGEIPCLEEAVRGLICNGATPKLRRSPVDSPTNKKPLNLGVLQEARRIVAFCYAGTSATYCSVEDTK